jgi:SpoVK/Ycf46/Vps4 family AAA+-type ATPase
VDENELLTGKIARRIVYLNQSFHRIKPQMDDNDVFSEDLVHLARLSLAGRQQDVQMLVMRLSRKYMKLAPKLGEKLLELVKMAPTRQSPLRSEGLATVPVDRDSRLQLLRIVDVPALEHEPLWTASIAAQLDQIVSEHTRAAELLKNGLSPTRTAIFTGPPGVGKTLAANWLAKELKRPLVVLDLSAVMSSFLGRTGANLRHVLDYAKGVSCVLLLDELDAIAKRRDDSHEVGELKRLVTVLLQEIDDWPEGGLLVAASNHGELLDPAAWRRFESHIEFTLPDSNAIEKAVSMFLESSCKTTKAWIAALGSLLRGSSFSDIERELKSLRRQAIMRNCSPCDLFPKLAGELIQVQSKATKQEIAIHLSETGLSQRLVNEITGVSRDTIRKRSRLASASPDATSEEAVGQ